MKDFTVLPCQMPRMDDDEAPYVPLWRVVINGKPHRDMIEEEDPVIQEEKAHLIEPSKSVH